MQLVVFQFSEQAICNWHFASHKLSMSPPIADSHWTSNLQSSVLWELCIKPASVFYRYNMSNVCNSGDNRWHTCQFQLVSYQEYIVWTSSHLPQVVQCGHTCW